MDFELTDDQQALAGGIRSLLAGRFGLERIRAAEGQRRVVDLNDWTELGQAGVFSLTLPEELGGVGLGLADAAVVFEELGRALVAGPLVGTALAAGLVEGAAEGEAVVGILSPPAPAVPAMVEHLDSVTALLAFPDDGPVGVVDPTSLHAVHRNDPLDPLTPVWQLSGPFPHGREATDTTASARLRQEGAVLTAALQVGHAAAVVDSAVAYAKERNQFGRPIGSFQAVKHLCADMLVRAEVARCAVHAAACLADQPEAAAMEAEASGLEPAEVVRRSVAGSKALADEAAVANARACIQVHGGMGFTWEVPVHLHLKRALVLATTFGSAAAHLESVAQLSGRRPAGG